jgi:hypothetical protein
MLINYNKKSNIVVELNCRFNSKKIKFDILCEYGTWSPTVKH